jgi:hypothetical protein
MNELDAFLDKLEEELGFLDREVAKDIKEEIRSHILDSAEASGRPVEEIILAMGNPEDIARRYKEEFASGEEPRRKGVRVEFAPDEEERKGWSRCPGGNGPWPGGCFEQGGREDGHDREDGHRHGEPWEELGKAFGRFGREFGQYGREFGRMARAWAREAENQYRPYLREYGRQMRDFFKDSFAADEEEGDGREIELRYPKAAHCRFDFTRARIAVKKGVSEEIVMRVKLRGRNEGSAPWMPRENRSGDSSFSLAEPFPAPPFQAAFARRVEIEIPEGVESIELKSISGSIEVEGLSASIRASSASGDISLSRSGGDLSCRTASGNLRVEGAPGKLDAQAVSGDIRVRCASGRPVEFASVSGKLRIYGEKPGRSGEVPGSGPALRLSTVSGDIELESE